MLVTGFFLFVCACLFFCLFVFLSIEQLMRNILQTFCKISVCVGFNKNLFQETCTCTPKL